MEECGMCLLGCGLMFGSEQGSWIVVAYQKMRHLDHKKVTAFWHVDAPLSESIFSTINSHTPPENNG